MKNFTEQEKLTLLDKLSNSDDIFKIIEEHTILVNAARCIVQNQLGSSSLLERRLSLSSDESEKVMGLLTQLQIIGPYLGSLEREVRVKTEIELEGIIECDLSLFKSNLQKLELDNNHIIENKKLAKLMQIKEEKLLLEKKIIRQELLEIERKEKLRKDVLEELIAEGLISNKKI
jgi:hypothetical protein